MPRALASVIFLSVLSSACGRRTGAASLASDASAPLEIPVRVPAALAVARAIDTLSVAVDPASLGLTQVTSRAGAVLGIETDVAVFAQGRPEPVLVRRDTVPGIDFAVCTSTWDTRRDGIPAPGTKYVVEMKLVLFETDVPRDRERQRDWNPRAGSFKALWARTLRQAEE